MAANKISPNKSMSRIREKNIRFIQEKLEHYLELQVLTVSFVEDALAEREGGGDKPKRKNKSADTSATKVFNDDEPGFAIPPDATIPRQAHGYSAWKKGLISELFCYCEPTVWTAAKKRSTATSC